MSDEILIPECFDISPEATAEADAALDPQPVPPADASVAEDKNGKRYERWAEVMSIEGVSMSRSPKGHTMFLIQGKIRPSGAPGQKNVGKRIYTRLTVNFPTLQAQALRQPIDEQLAKMNTRSLGTLQSLLRSTGYAPTEGGLKAALLKTLFPQADDPVTQSQLLGKVVVASVVRSENKGGKYKFDVRAESFSPAPTS